MKKFFLFFLLTAFSFGLFASPVTLESAKSVAVNFYKNYSAKSNVAVSNVITYQKDGLNTFYVITFETGGFVVVSADDAVIPVLGYSPTDTFDKNNLPDAEKSWLASYSNHIKYIVDHNLSNVETSKEWVKIKNNEFEKSVQAVTPLCSTLWDQSAPYYNLCPVVNSQHCVTGCVATALAQIMKKWNYPTTGTGTYTYTPTTNASTIGPLTVNFGTTTYDWANMINTGGTTTAQKTAVATLMYHCGVSVSMDYDPNGSGAYPWDVPPALINHFNYSPTAELKVMADFTSANWITMLKGELDAGRPILYTGDDGTAGHAFVFDGYNSSNQFHVNWGWSGQSNNYYAVGSLNPSGDNFNSDNMAVVRITPPLGGPIADFTASTTTPIVGGTVNFTNNSTNNPTTYSWVFDGGTPSTSTLQTPPAITYSTAGIYQVSLTVSNSSGTDTKIRTSYINVGGTPSAWIKQNSGFATASRGIEQIAIVNPYIVWATAYDGSGGSATIQEFTKTKNGGSTWTPGTIVFTNSTTYGIANLSPFNDTLCFAAMYPATAANGGVIVKTIDGGTTWTILPNSPDYSTSWLDLVHFFNANDGVCMGDPNTAGKYIIYTTNNGGNTWTQTPVANIPNCSSGETGVVNLCDAVGDTLWFGTTKGRIYKTTDKGLTWTVVATGLGTSAAIEPRFKDSMNGIVIGTNYSTGAYIGLKKTTDGGATWTTLTPTGFFVKVPRLDYVPGTSNMLVDVSASAPSSTTDPGSSYSLDGGSTFLNIDTGSVQYTTVTFYDYNTGWAGGFNASSSDGGIYKWNSSVITSVPPTPQTGVSDIRVYPNPTNDFVNVVFPEYLSSKVTIDVYNMLGEKVLSQEVQSGTNIARLNMSKNNAGVYLLIMNDGTKVTTKRISKIR
jgi:PKD repeat protein